MNPIIITVLVLPAWMILAPIVLGKWIIKDPSMGIAAILGPFYLAPFVCLLVYIVSSFFYYSWVKTHKVAAAVMLAVMIIWTLLIVLYVRSLVR